MSIRTSNAATAARSRSSHAASPLASTQPPPPAPSSIPAGDPKALAALEAAVAAWNLTDGPEEAHGARRTVYSALRALLAFVLGTWATPGGKATADAFDAATTIATEAHHARVARVWLAAQALVKTSGPEAPREALAFAVGVLDAAAVDLSSASVEATVLQEVTRSLRALEALLRLGGESRSGRGILDAAHVFATSATVAAGGGAS